MRLLQLTLVTAFTAFSVYPIQDAPRMNSESISCKATFKTVGYTEITNLMFQSKDGGETWQDVSHSLPENQQPDDFFVGESDAYLRIKNVLYRSSCKLALPQWEKENIPALQNANIAFSQSGLMAFNYEGGLYRKPSAAESWSPFHTNIRTYAMRSIFETSNGFMFIGTDMGLYRSEDRGKNWQQIQNEGWVMEMAESDGVLIGTGQKGIMRSEDNGEHWEWVIREGGVGIAVETIKGGFAAIAFNTSTNTRKIHLSFDKGKTWQTIDEGLPPSMSISSIKQVGNNLFCGHPDGIFRSADLGKTWNLVHPLVEKKVVNYGTKWTIIDSAVKDKVLKLYVSGDVMYAVARNFGC